MENVFVWQLLSHGDSAIHRLDPRTKLLLALCF